MSRVPPLPLFVLILLPLIGADGGAVAAGPSDATPISDPWATTKSCTKVLEKFVQCQTEASFRKLLARWTGPAGAAKLSTKRLQELSLRWQKSDGRRVQCAVWTRREEAANHIGVASPIVKLLEKPPTSCERFGRELDASPWFPTAMAAADEP